MPACGYEFYLGVFNLHGCMCCWDFVRVSVISLKFYGGGVIGPTTNPQPGGPGAGLCQASPPH